MNEGHKEKKTDITQWRKGISQVRMTRDRK
jgi:hypothetical protein